MRIRASFSAFAVVAVLSVSDVEFDRLLQPRGPAERQATEHAACASGAELVEHYRYYGFSGVDARDADHSLRQRLLVSQDFAGRTTRFAGQADWDIKWQPCLERFGPACRIVAVASQVHVTYTLPRWIDRVAAHPDLGSRWDHYATNLLAHEKGHGRIALEVAHVMARELTGLAAFAGCEAVKTEARRTVRAIMRQGEAMQNDYDRVTGHGSRQGATFPF